MKKWLIIFLGVALIFAGGWAFYALGNLPADAATHVVLHIDADTVEIKRGGNTEWQKAKTNDELSSGDSIKTGENGSATISFFGLGESRLGPNSEIMIEQAEYPARDAAPFLVKMKIGNGRVWSRVLRLLDLDSAFTVRSNSVIATVRGTGFDMNTSVSGTTVIVSESAVQISGSSRVVVTSLVDNPLILTEGYLALFDEKGSIIKSEAVSDEEMHTDWFLKNTARDEAFIKKAVGIMTKNFSSQSQVVPETFRDSLVKLSEKLHLSLNADRAPMLYARYVLRRLFAIKQLIDQGESGKGFKALSSLEEEINIQLGSNDGERYRLYLTSRFRDLILLMQGVGPDTPALYRLKQRIEDLKVQLSGSNAVEMSYTRLTIIDSRLDEAIMLIEKSSLDDAKSILDTARQGIGNVERDIDHLPDNTPSAKLDLLRGRLFALKARETAIRTRLATAISPPTALFIDQGSVSSTTSTIEMLPSTTTTESVSTTTVKAVIQRISIFVQPNPVLVGETARISVRATKDDGMTVDVTAKSKFSLLGSLGLLNGPLYTATAPGGITIQASYLEEGETYSATLSLQVLQKPVSLKSLELVAQGQTTVQSGQQIPLVATAFYSDGSKKTVTTLASYSTSNSSAGIVSQGVFIAQKMSGLVRVTAAYQENGVEAAASLDFAVVAR